MSVSETEVARSGPRGDAPASATPSAAFARDMLPLVSRTFALTIPQLPKGLREPVTNAYLLCRIVDTVEDDPALTTEQKDRLQALFVEALDDPSQARHFAAAAGPLLSEHTLEAERRLAAHVDQVLRDTQALSAPQRGALKRCLHVMCSGMGRFQRARSVGGLATLADLKDYCYVVAGVVGEMLTDLFCDHSPSMHAQRATLMVRAASFGRGLQMTNILKDIWEDRAAETCWLPREVFAAQGCDLSQLTPGGSSQSFEAGLNELIAVAHGYLREALAYTLTIPKQEIGIRRFCLWSLGLAVLTLRQIHRRPGFAAGSEVKVSRRAVHATILTTNLAARSNRALSGLFDWFANELPLCEVKNEPAPGAAR